MPHDAFSSHEIAVTFVKGGASKCRSHPVATFIRACFSGMFLGFGGALSTLIGGGTHGVAEDNPAVTKLLAAACFPVGIIMTVLNSQELLTSNMMSVPMAVMCKQARWYWIPFNWTLVFFGNLVGTLFWDALLVKYSGIFTPSYAAYAIKFASTKVVTPTWGMILLRGIGCNLLVCLAVWQATGAREVISKIIALWIPIFIFVALGFDHVVANMYYIPIAIMWGSPDVSTGLYIWKSIIPSFIGNAIGALLVGVPYRYLFIDDLAVFGPTAANTGANVDNVELGPAPSRSHADEERDAFAGPSFREQLQLRLGYNRTPGRSRAESTLGGGRTPSVKSGQEGHEK
ncbi:hypothetical protein P389DRAFT_191322 [Cystobasidium minutum MCA 4210]|uniref:uncharacterized protein n=1 Tax=Cystobasidium minutum MCA 4210 TaxID=1397322 RepID=UPI0034CDA045|eukprot:jgi/Rhomi1/191322/estExt_fgenesh1_pg.C_80078